MWSLQFILLFRLIDDVGDGFGLAKALAIGAVFGEIGFQYVGFEGVPFAVAIVFDLIEVVVEEVEVGEFFFGGLLIGEIIVVDVFSIFLFAEEGDVFVDEGEGAGEVLVGLVDEAGRGDFGHGQ